MPDPEIVRREVGTEQAVEVVTETTGRPARTVDARRLRELAERDDEDDDEE